MLARVGSRTASGVGADLRSAFAGVPEGVATVLLGLVLGAYLVLVLATPVWLLLRRRFGLLGRVLLGAVVGLVGYGLVIRLPSVQAWVTTIESAAHDFGTVPQAWEIAALAAVTAVVRPAMSPRWSRALWTLLVLLALVRVVSVSAGPVGVLLAIGIGGAAGSLLLLALGRAVPELTPAGLAQLLAGCGLPVVDVVPTAGRSDGWDFEASTTDGTPLQIRVVDERDWQADRLRRGYRRLRWREVGDESPFGSPVRAVTNEAMVGLLAAARGVRVAAVRAVAAGTQGEAVLAVERPIGPRLADLAPEAVTDQVLASAWHQVDELATARVAMRELSLDHLVLGSDGQVVLVGLDRAEPAAPDGVLAGDVAELLAATSVAVGPRRAVAAARAVLGTARLQVALARLVPAALSATTRAALKADPDALANLVTEVSAATGVEQPTFERIERFRPRTLLIAAMLVVAVYVLAPQLTDLPQLVATVRGADLRWLPAVLVASALTYAGAALGLAGGTPGRVPVTQAATVALASSFVATFAPPGVGQIGLNVRYLQKRGFSTAVAASASAAKEAAVLVMHLLILAGFAVWAGSTDALTGELSTLPSMTLVGGLVGALILLAGAALAVPQVRRVLRDRLLPAIRSSADAMRAVVASPAKIVALFGGVTLLPMGYALCLYASVRAFGVEAPFVAVALVSLTAGALATAAPTPGGVGAVEAVLLASLTGLGIASPSALAAVVLYRLATFWLPIAPGALAFRVLTARDVL
jgi:uncharacterized protein (TIRG00374 family)